MRLESIARVAACLLQCLIAHISPSFGPVVGLSIVQSRLKKKIVVVLNELQDFQLIILIGLLKSRKANLVTSRWC